MAKEEKKKVRRPQAIKRDIQNKKHRLANRAFKSKLLTSIRHFEDSLQKKEETSIKSGLSEVYSLLDKGVKNHIFKLNMASRTKARLTAKASAALA